jgi:hypothetical protein
MNQWTIPCADQKGKLQYVIPAPYSVRSLIFSPIENILLYETIECPHLFDIVCNGTIQSFSKKLHISPLSQIYRQYTPDRDIE